MMISHVPGSLFTIGNNWIPRFLKRNPEIRTKKGMTIASGRVVLLISIPQRFRPRLRIASSKICTPTGSSLLISKRWGEQAAH